MNIQKSRIRIKDIIIPLFLFVSTIIISGLFSTLGVDPHHDGIMLKPAMDVASGNMLFKESFSQYNTVTTLLQTVSLLLFGKYLLTIRLLTAFFYGFIAVLLYALYKTILPKTLIFVTVILWIFMAPYYITSFLPWSAVYAIFFQLLTAYLFIQSYRGESDIMSAGAGITCALIFWTRHAVGLQSIIFILFFFMYQVLFRIMPIPEIKRRFVSFMLGYLGVCTVFLFWLFTNHALNDWWLQTFTYGYQIGSHFGDGYKVSHILFVCLFPFTFNPGFINSTLIWILLPVSTLFLLVFYTFSVKNKRVSLKTFSVLVLVFIGLGSWMQYFPMMDYPHCYWAGTPMFGLLTYAIYLIVKTILAKLHIDKMPIALYVTLCIVIALFVPDISFRINEGVKKLQEPYYSVTKPTALQGMRFSQKDAQFFTNVSEKIDTYMNESPQHNVVTTYWDALYLTFNDQIRNFHPMYVNWSPSILSIYPDYEMKLFEYIEKTKPLVITTIDTLPLGYCRLKDSSERNGVFLALPCN